MKLQSNNSIENHQLSFSCPTEWNDMKPMSSCTRFCVQCSKPVYDFTGSSIEEYEKVRDANNGNVCGQYNVTENGSVYFLKKAKKPTLKFLIAFIILLNFHTSISGISNDTHSFFEKQRNEILALKKAPDSLAKVCVLFNGKPLRRAMVMVSVNQGEFEEYQTDRKGYVTLLVDPTQTIQTIEFKLNEDYAVQTITPACTANSMADNEYKVCFHSQSYRGFY